MFDIIIEYNENKKHFDTNFLKKNFKNIYSDLITRCNEFGFDDNKISVYGLSRKSDYRDFYQDADNILIIIGEVFLSMKGENDSGITKYKLDCEDIRDLLYKYPENYLLYIKGNFSIINYEKKTKSINIINSKYGISPIYYSIFKSSLIISTSLSVLKNIDEKLSEIDEKAILQKEIFNYTLGNRTLLRNVKAVMPAEIFSFCDSLCKTQIYWSSDELYNNELMQDKDAIDNGCCLFNKIIKDYSGDKDKYCASLTGGFDGRTILSVLGNENKELLLYSFGITDSLNISIPQQISAENGLNYLPILLEKDYEGVYVEFAKQSVIFSDCMRTIESANYPYAFNIVSAFSDVVITGIFGSELLRTFQNVGVMVSNNFELLNKSENSENSWILIKNKLYNSYLSRDIIDKNFEDVRNEFEEEIWGPISNFDYNKRFYQFMIREGLRKYFGGEVQSERIYATNRFPYLDDDFVNFIFQSPFAGVYSNALNPSPNQRFRSQYFYAKIMEKYYPILLKYQTDHGFPASYVLSKIPVLKIGIPFLYNRRKKKKSNYQEFKPVEWAELFLNDIDNCLTFGNNDWYNDKLLKDYRQGLWKNNFYKFSNAISFNYWMNS